MTPFQNFDTLPPEKYIKTQIKKQITMELTQKIARAWLVTMLSEEIVKRFNGKWTAIKAGEVLHAVDQSLARKTLTWPREEESCGHNRGCSVFHTGTGISILSCESDLYYELADKVKNGAKVLAYNNGVLYDTEDKRILKMSVLCKHYAE